MSTKSYATFLMTILLTGIATPPLLADNSASAVYDPPKLLMAQNNEQFASSQSTRQIRGQPDTPGKSCDHKGNGDPNHCQLAPVTTLPPVTTPVTTRTAAKPTTETSTTTATSIEDNQILELVLTKSYDDGGFTVVKPKSSTGMGKFDKDHSKHMLKRLEESGVSSAVLTKLIDMFARKNEKPVTLTLASKPDQGYIVDYEGKFSRYFEGTKLDGWELWRKENPKAHCSTSVSLPAYDKEHELILIYIGQQCDWLMGSGGIILFKKEGDKLRELGQVGLWVS